MTQLKRLMIDNKFSRRKARSVITLFQKLCKRNRKRYPRPGALPLD